MINIQNKDACCGCSACHQICPKKCISMEADAEGFLYPKVDAANCIDCNMCSKVCPVINTAVKSDEIIRAYACYNVNQNQRLRSSSGGLFYLIAEYVISRNGVVYGAAFDKDFNVCHTCVDNLQDLEKLMGSKYVQSDVGDTFAQVKKLLTDGKLVLFSGTACQISGLKSFLQKKYENLITVDVLCHGTPSPKLWKRYLNEQSENNGSACNYVSFRAKTQGWKRFSMRIAFENGCVYDKNLLEDPFLRLFLCNICLRPSCYNCRFKSLDRDSDISLGDCWGIENVFSDMDDDKGASVVIVHSPKGEELFDSISDRLHSKEHDVDILLPKSMDSRCSVKMHPKRTIFFEQLDKGEKIPKLLKLTELSFKRKALNKIKRILKRVCAFRSR